MSLSYFSLRASSSDAMAELISPTDETGHAVDRRTLVTSDLQAYSRCIDARSMLCDCVPCLTELVISSSAASIVRDMRTTPGTRLVPLHIYSSEDEYLSTHELLLMPSDVNCVDLTKSKYKRLTDKVIWYFTEPPVIKYEVVMNFDLFFDVELLWCCSSAFKERVESEGLLGFEFIPTTIG